MEDPKLVNRGGLISTLKITNYSCNILDFAIIIFFIGLSRKHIFDAIEASLKRLGVSYIDLYQINRFDYNVWPKTYYLYFSKCCSYLVFVS